MTRRVSGLMLLMSAMVLVASCASTQPLPTPQITRSVGPYHVTADKTIIDERSGLEWLPGPEQSVGYERAVEMIKKVDAFGGGWRMPTYAEYRTVTVPTAEVDEGHTIDPVFLDLLGEPKTLFWTKGEGPMLGGLTGVPVRARSGNAVAQWPGNPPETKLKRVLAVRARR